jgi:hypothetical protein
LRSSVVTTGAGAQPLLELRRLFPRHRCRRVVERLLDLGDRRDRDLDRQHVVENMVVAQVSVSENIVADRLARAKAAAMADHEPGFGPQHGKVVAHRFGVGRADADVDERDAAAVLGDEVVGGHLELAPGAGLDLRQRIGRVGLDEDAARRRQRFILAVLGLQLPPPPTARTRRHSGHSW